VGGILGVALKEARQGVKVVTGTVRITSAGRGAVAMRRSGGRRRRTHWWRRAWRWWRRGRLGTAEGR
jgi:hypothetical protein